MENSSPEQSLENQDSNFEGFKTPQEELNFLRGRLEQIEKALPENIENKTERAAQKILNEYEKVDAEEVLHEDLEMSNAEQGAIVLSLEPEPHDEKISELISLIHEKGIKNAVSVVNQLEDPHIVDDFHRFLVAYIGAGYSNEKDKISESDPIYKSLHRVLFEIAIPDNLREEKESQLKEIVTTMQQVYSGVLSVSSNDKNSKNEYITLEIAKPIKSHDFVFYLSVPELKVELFKKQIHSFFPEITLTEQLNDFNVFSYQGEHAVGYLKHASSSVRMLKTIDDFDTDPMKSILNALSRLDSEDEGAAIQLVFKPVGDFYDKQYTKALRKMQDGETGVLEVDVKNTTGSKVYKKVASITRETYKMMQKESDNPMDQSDKPNVDSVLMSNVEQKVEHPIVSTNIRLVASSKSEQKSNSILEDLASSFNQFKQPTGNNLTLSRILKNKKKSALSSFSYRLYDLHHDVPLNLLEVATIFHFPEKTELKNPQLKISKAKTSPASTHLPNKEKSEGGIILGENTHAGNTKEIFMLPKDRVRHMYVIGQTGTGKSVFLQNLIIQDIKNGDGACFIDPHGSDVQDILANIPPERFEDVIYFDPAHTKRPMALNMLEYDTNYPEQKTFVVNELFSIFQKLYGANPESMGPMFEQYFRNATMLVIEDPETGNTLLDVSRVLSDKSYRDLKISRCNNPVVKEFWTNIASKAGGEASLENIVPYITSKFDVFLANDIMRPVIAQEKSSFNFRQIMDEKKILLVNLSKGRLGDINANLIGLILVGKILMAALSRVDNQSKDLPPFYLYIDEFQNVTTDSIATILSEARKYKLSLNIAHQFIAQLEENIKDAVFGNVGSMAVFRVGSDDAEYLQNQFVPHFSAGDIMNIENYNCYMKLLSDGVPQDPFNILTYPPKEGREDIVGDLKNLSYYTYGEDRNVVEEKIMKKYGKKSDKI